MYFNIVEKCTPITIEQIEEYTIKYDDFVFYSVWYEERCILENVTWKAAREFCKVRINRSCEIVFVLNTYLLTIRGHYFSRYVDQEAWHRRHHVPWIGFYPIPEKVEKESLLYTCLIRDFIEAEKTGKISLYYKSFCTARDRHIYNRL